MGALSRIARTHSSPLHLVSGLDLIAACGPIRHGSFDAESVVKGLTTEVVVASYNRCSIAIIAFFQI